MTEKTEKAKQAQQSQQAQVMGLFDEAMRSYEHSMRTGLKMQEEAGKWWTQVFNQATSPQDWQRRINRMADDIIPSTQKGVAETMKLLEQNSRSGVDLLKKAVEATQTASFSESQAKWVDFWEMSLKTMRSNAQAVNELNGRAIDSWIDFLWRNPETVSPRTAKAM